MTREYAGTARIRPSHSVAGTSRNSGYIVERFNGVRWWQTYWYQDIAEAREAAKDINSAPARVAIGDET